MQLIPIFDIQALKLALTPEVFYDIMYPVMDVDAEIKELKIQLRDLVFTHIKENKIEVEKARALVRAFLAILPIKNQQELLFKLQTLGKEYEEVKELYIKEVAKVNDAKKDAALKHMRDAIKQGNLEQAQIGRAHV